MYLKSFSHYGKEIEAQTEKMVFLLKNHVGI